MLRHLRAVTFIRESEGSRKNIFVVRKPLKSYQLLVFTEHILYIHIHILYVSWGSVVGIATAYGLDDRVVGVRVPVESEFSLLHIILTGSGAHPASYPMGTGGGGLSPEVKRQGREPDHSLPDSTEVKKMWIYTSTPTYAFMV
jgi:hypothetical protein